VASVVVTGSLVVVLMAAVVSGAAGGGFDDSAAVDVHAAATSAEAVRSESERISRVTVKDRTPNRSSCRGPGPKLAESARRCRRPSSSPPQT
jgi:hypothetical protein